MIEKTTYGSGMDMIYLASCALHGTVPEKERMKAMNPAAVYKLAVKHSMQAMTWIGVENYLKSGETPEIPPDLLQKWKESKAKSVRKIILFEEERRKILDFMEEQGCWYMPLKGVILQDFYPVLGMRQFADNDILFDEAYREAVRDFMAEQGYEVTMYKKHFHDTYHKQPVLNFEMHVTLCSERNDVLYRYYRNVKERLVKDEGNRYGYHFTEEDFYVYFTSHSYKHFSSAGVGIRSLMDVYVYLTKLSDRLDWTYIEAELEKLGILAFEQKIRALSMKLFSGDPVQLTEEEQELTAFYIDSGTYGTFEGLVSQKLNKLSGDGEVTLGTKVRYFFGRLFPDIEPYRKIYPFFYKHRVLLPVFWGYRLVKGIFTKPKRLLNELKLLGKVKK